MQGYILHTQKVRDEDLLVFILTHEKLKTLYRFYGARHSSVHLGYKVDFEVESEGTRNIKKLRHVMHLGFAYLKLREKFYLWQQFCKLLHSHLKGVESVDGFYFELLDTMSARLEKQSAKRLFVESYTAMLEHEGRLHELQECFFCGKPLSSSVTLVRAFLPSCESCTFGEKLDIKALKELWNQKSTLKLGDTEVNALWNTVSEGL